MTESERLKRLNELKGTAINKIDELKKEIAFLCKTIQREKINKEEIENLRKDLIEWGIVLDTYEFLEYELDL